MTLGNQIIGEGIQDVLGSIEVILIKGREGILKLDVLRDFGASLLDNIWGTKEGLLAIDFILGLLETPSGHERINLLLDAEAVGIPEILEKQFRRRELGVEDEGLLQKFGGAEVVDTVGQKATGFIDEISGLAKFFAHLLESGVGDGGEGGGVLGWRFGFGGTGIAQQGQDENRKQSRTQRDPGEGETPSTAGGEVAGFDGDEERNIAQGENILILKGSTQDTGATKGNAID